MEELERLVSNLEDIFTGEPPNISELRRIFGVKRALHGEDVDQVCRELRLQRRRVESLLAEVRREGFVALAPGYQERLVPEELRRRRLGIAQMLLGTLAEKRFAQLADEITGGSVLRIEDHRPSRTDTDYRLLNGQWNPICRLNIKFHGTLFRDARRYVGLDPEDCFALATYKIRNALRRQEEERLPYVFLVLSVRDLSAADVATLIPEGYVWTLAVLEGRRALEEAIVERLGGDDYRDGFRPVLDRMPEGRFRIISAQKAYNLLKDKLFERVHALTLRGFTRKFRNAEIDMHLSLSQELAPIRAFLELVVTESPQRAAVRLYVGDY